VQRYARSGFSNDALHQSAITNARSERGSTADLLADLAEIDWRKFYLAMAYPSLFAYCTAELRLSEDAAYKRIKAVRAARRFPTIFEAVADGMLNLTGVVLLAPHLTESTAPELLAAAMNQSRLEIEKLLAARFPRPDVPDCVAPITLTSCTAAAPQEARGPVQDSSAVSTERTASHEQADPTPDPSWRPQLRIFSRANRPRGLLTGPIVPV
jgi:hypothetical protein